MNIITVRFDDCYIEETIDRLLCVAEAENLDVSNFREQYDLYGEENAIQDDMNYDLLRSMTDEIKEKFEDEGFEFTVHRGYFEITKREI